MKRIAFVVLAVLVALSFSAAVYAADKPVEKAKDAQIMPKKVQVDTTGDGKPDRTEYYDDAGQVTKVEADTNGDGIVDETVIYENGKPVKSIKDTNKDGKPDVWIDF